MKSIKILVVEQEGAILEKSCTWPQYAWSISILILRKNEKMPILISEEICSFQCWSDNYNKMLENGKLIHDYGSTM